MLRLDNKPTLIPLGGQCFHDLFEIQRSIAGHGEGPFDHRIKETLHFAIQRFDDRQSHVLGVNMADPRVVVFDNTQIVATSKSHVTGIKQQRHRGMFHEKIKLGLGFNRGRHMVVIADRHAFCRAPIGKIRHLAPIFCHLGLGQYRLLRQGGVALALN